MAYTFAAKAPTEVVTRRWAVPVADGDSPSAVALVASGVTVDSDSFEGNELVLVLSGGAAGATGSVAATVSTQQGETLVETLYVPVAASGAASVTARDIVAFALRKIVGNGVDADSAEAADALERLNDMLAMWRGDGMDIGVPGKMELGTSLPIEEEYIAAIKFNLRVSCHSHYGEPVDAYDARMAEDGKRLIGRRLLRLNDLVIAKSLTSPAHELTDLF